MDRLGREAAAGQQPGDHRVRVPHLARAQLVSTPDRARQGPDQVEETVGQGRVVAQHLGAGDRLVGVGDDPVSPAAHLVAEHPPAGHAAAAHQAFDEHATRRAVGGRDGPAVLDHKAPLGHAHHQRGVVQVERPPVLQERVDGLPDAPVQADEPAAGPEWQPVQLDAGHDRLLVSSSTPRLWQAAADATRGERPLPAGTSAASATVAALGWLGLSVLLSLPWVRELATTITVVPATLVVGFVAYLPGGLVAFLAVSLLLDRQPPLRRSHPTIPVTVLVAARNEADRIQETISYIARQDYPGPIEVLVVDNGSTDGTRALAEAYGAATGQRVRCIDEPRPGKSHALNTGLAAVETELVITLDADTLLHPQAIRQVVARLLSAPTRCAGHRRLGPGPQQPRQPLDGDAGMGLLPGHRVGEADAGAVSGHAGRPGRLQPLPDPGAADSGWLARRHRRGHRPDLAAHAPGGQGLLRALRGRVHRRPGPAGPPGPPAGPLGAWHARGHPEREAMEPAAVAAALPDRHRPAHPGPGRRLRAGVAARPGPGGDWPLLDRRAVHPGRATAHPGRQRHPVPLPATPGLQPARAPRPAQRPWLRRLRPDLPDAHVTDRRGRLHAGAPGPAPPLEIAQTTPGQPGQPRRAGGSLAGRLLDGCFSGRARISMRRTPGGAQARWRSSRCRASSATALGRVVSKSISFAHVGVTTIRTMPSYSVRTSASHSTRCSGVIV